MARVRNTPKSGRKNPFTKIAAGNDNQPGGGKGGVRTPYIGTTGGLTGSNGRVTVTPGVSGGYTGDSYILTEPFPENDNKRRR